MKTNEELIHQEMQGLRVVGYKLVEWGIALLVIGELALALIRRKGYENLIAAKQLMAGEPLPFGRHLLGTILLLVVATIFTVMTVIVSRRFRFYSNLLRNDKESTVPVPTDVAGAETLIVVLYIVFPLLDLLLWPYLRFVSGSYSPY